ncbi:hypothetical protein ACFE04_014304 [Oxalis oulophora]
MSSTTTTTTTMQKPKPQAHILIFPFPAQGHTLPLLHLTHHLSLHFTITILTTPKNLTTLSPLLSSNNNNNNNNNIQTLILPFPHHPNLPPNIENVKDLGNKGNLPIMSALTKLSQPIINWFNSHPNPPITIISDFFLGWTGQLAAQLGIPRIAFYSSGAFLVSAFNYLWESAESIKCSDHHRDVALVDLPGSPVFKEEHVPSVFMRFKVGDPDLEFLRDDMLANRKCWGLVVNTFQGLEGVYLDHLKDSLPNVRVFSVGPLCLLGRPDDDNNDCCWVDTSLFRWLDDCPDESVLYVCFGSQKLLSKSQMESLASGLETSMVRFVWVAKQGENRYGLVPEGFEERVADRGMVIKGWAPQCSILNHKAVGGFLSHCGWNSTLEGIVAGVRFLAWPMEADQFIDARLLVEKGIGVIVCDGADTVPDPAELSKVICDSMSRSGEEVLSRAKEMRDEAFAAVKAGGSSKRDLEKLIDELSNLK